MKKGVFCTLLLMLLLVCLSFLPTEAQAAGAENLTFVANSNASYTVVHCDASAAGELEIPATHNGYPVTSISDFAFLDCTKLTAIVVPEGIKDIGVGAFSGCTGLTRITVPNTIVNVGIYAFDGCTSLIYNTYKNAKYLGNESNPYVLLTNAISAHITSCQIHEDTRSIGYEAFSGCAGLTEITVPDKVAAIGNLAFEGCTGLQKVALGSGVTRIGEMAFRGCAGLRGLAFPDGVTTIGMYAFSGCSGLTEIVLPSGLADIDWYAFEGCTGLEKVIFQGTCVAWNALTAHGETGISATILYGSHCYAWVTTEEATCISEGTMTYMCTGCGETEGETKPTALAGHSYGGWTEVKSPTTEETGTEERKCIHCDEKEEREIAKLEIIPTEPSEPSTEPSAPNPTEPTVGADKKKDGNSAVWVALIVAVCLLAVGVAVVFRKYNKKA